MHHRMRTVSFAMVFVATSLHIADKGYSLAAWSFLVALLLIYPHVQYWRALRAPDSIEAEMRNLLADSVLLGVFIATVEFSDWLSFSVVLGTLTNNSANKGWRGIRQAFLALLAGILVGVLVTGFKLAPRTDWPATLFCIVGLGGYLLAMNNIGFARNVQLRQTRKKLELREAELVRANETLLGNIREIDELQMKLSEQANRDPLTGLYNRRFLDASLERELARSNREGKPLALVMIDVDHFKKFNDRYGHQEGDECLRSVARALQASAQRGGDLAARYGGEEFLLILADTDALAAQGLAESVRCAVEALGMTHQQSPFGKVTISIGVAVRANGFGKDARTLLRAADDALYRAKQSGRNQVQLAPESRDAIAAGAGAPAGLVQLVWHPAYECGNVVLDGQHRALFGHANKLLAAILGERPADEVAVLVDALIGGVVQHFADEEALIAVTGFPDTAQHASMHRELAGRAADLASRLRAGTLDVGELFQFLAHDVVARHMLGADRDFAPYLEVRSGVVAASVAVAPAPTLAS